MTLRRWLRASWAKCYRVAATMTGNDDDSEGGFRHEQFTVIDQTPWGVPVIDVQPLTQHVVSTSRDPACAANAISYRGDDGPELAAQALESTRVTDCALRLPIDEVLVDGIVHKPDSMEDKWAVYVEGGRLLFVRSWRRQVVATADVRVDGGSAVIGPIHGAFIGDDDEPGYTRRVLEYLVRNIALGEGLPTPLPGPFEDHVAAATYCFSVFGQRARFATHHEAELAPPQRPLCTYTRLHIAAARQQIDRIPAIVGEGVPLVARGPDGLTALHWVSRGESTAVAIALLDAGTPVDVRSRMGATPLMQATQSKSVEHVRLLLARGADPNAGDHRRFTALHRAAEMGLAEIVEVLLAAGARPDVEAEGQTPAGLATAREEHAIARRLGG